MQVQQAVERESGRDGVLSWYLGCCCAVCWQPGLWERKAFPRIRATSLPKTLSTVPEHSAAQSPFPFGPLVTSLQTPSALLCLDLRSPPAQTSVFPFGTLMEGFLDAPRWAAVFTRLG